MRDSSVYLMSSLNAKMFSNFRETKNSIILANIEFRNRELLSDMEQVERYRQIHQTLVDVIKSNFYPYIYIYELNNQACVLVSNLCCSYNMPRYCASMMICCLYNIWNDVAKHKTDLAIGVSYGKCQIGALANGDIRIFGSTYNESIECRQRATPTLNCICVHEFVYKLSVERFYQIPLFEKLMSIQASEGGPTIRCNTIDLSTIDNSIFHQESESFSESEPKMSTEGRHSQQRSPEHVDGRTKNDFS